MTFKIGGFAAHSEPEEVSPVCVACDDPAAPRRSLVDVKFPGRGMALTYYNDSFDLKIGDSVYVDGKLEGQAGRVVAVHYNFKIRLADYKKVIAVVDTDVYGEFYMAGAHFLAFDPQTLPAEKATLWFRAPEMEETEYARGNDDSVFPLDDLTQMGVDGAIAERGNTYYIENRVRYLCVDHGHATAVVAGGENYVVEFDYQEGQIRNLVCDCPCGGRCKHEFATMLQLLETLETIEKHYAEEYRRSDYFAAIHKGILFSFAVDGRETGRISL